MTSRQITSQELAQDPAILLRRQGTDQSEAIRSFEGQVGAVLLNGTHFITSPNMDRIHAPPRNGRISYKTNMRLGEHDPLQWPQVLIPEFMYLAAIRQKPNTLPPANVFNFVFQPFDRSWCQLSLEGPLSGLYSLKSALISQAKDFIRIRVDGKLAEYRQRPDAHENNILSKLQILIRRTLTLLENLPMSRRQIEFLFSELQRYCLEFTAAFDFLTIYRPRMAGELEAGAKVAKTVGAIVQNPSDAEALFRAGLPVWVVRPAALAGTMRIDALCDMLEPETFLCLDDDLRFSVHYEGALNQPARYMTFGRYARDYISYGDAFQLGQRSHTSVPPVGGQPSSAAGPSRASRQAFVRDNFRTLTGPYPVPQRTDFSEPVSAYLPPSTHAWADGLLKINTGAQRQWLAACSNWLGGTILPNPAVFCGVSNDSKRDTCFANWLKFRPALMYRLTDPAGRVPVGAQLWRDLIRLPDHDNSSSATQGSKRAKRTEFLAKLLKDCDLTANGVSISTEPCATAWRGEKLDTFTVDKSKEILWELSEHNFRFDLLAADYHLHRTRLAGTNTTHAMYSQEDDVLLCFPGGSQGTTVMVASFEHADVGLAAQDWQTRHPYIISLCQVMGSWDGFEGAVAKVLEVDLRVKASRILNMTEYDFLPFEKHLVALFIQFFYDVFGRAPIIPRRLH